MSQGINVQGYLDTINTPWGQLFYKLIWHNINCEHKKILDFGSGFGITADYLAKSNDVTAVEPNEEMLAHGFCSNDYRQIVGGIEKLIEMTDQSYDVIICHNVMEYLDNREELISEFSRLLKKDGFLSVVKHNKAGKIMQKAVFEYNIDDAVNLLNNGDTASVNFGTIREYDINDLEKYCEDSFVIDKIYGVRTFFGLQRNELKTNPDWLSDMYALECAVEEISEFRNVAFFQHIILSHSFR